MDLKDIYMICRGEKKQTNDHRKLISDLTRGIIPKSWKVDYKIPRDTTVKYKYILEKIRKRLHRLKL
jgi:hypothetical protein